MLKVNSPTFLYNTFLCLQKKKSRDLFFWFVLLYSCSSCVGRSMHLYMYIMCNCCNRIDILLCLGLDILEILLTRSLNDWLFCTSGFQSAILGLTLLNPFYCSLQTLIFSVSFSVSLFFNRNLPVR